MSRIRLMTDQGRRAAVRAAQGPANEYQPPKPQPGINQNPYGGSPVGQAQRPSAQPSGPQRPQPAGPSYTPPSQRPPISATGGQAAAPTQAPGSAPGVAEAMRSGALTPNTVNMWRQAQQQAQAYQASQQPQPQPQAQAQAQAQAQQAQPVSTAQPQIGQTAAGQTAQTPDTQAGADLNDFREFDNQVENQGYVGDEPPAPPSDPSHQGHDQWVMSELEKYVDNGLLRRHGMNAAEMAQEMGLRPGELLFLLQQGYEFSYQPDNGFLGIGRGHEWRHRGTNGSWEDWHDEGGRGNSGAAEALAEARRQQVAGETPYATGTEEEEEDPARAALDEYLESLSQVGPPEFPQEALDRLQQETLQQSAYQQAAAMKVMMEANARARGAVGQGSAAASQVQTGLQTEAQRQVAQQDLEAQVQNYQGQLAHYDQQLAGLRAFYSHQLGQQDRAALVEAEKALLEHRNLLAAELANAQSSLSRVLQGAGAGAGMGAAIGAPFGGVGGAIGAGIGGIVGGVLGGVS